MPHPDSDFEEDEDCLESANTAFRCPNCDLQQVKKALEFLGASTRYEITDYLVSRGLMEPPTARKFVNAALILGRSRGEIIESPVIQNFWDCSSSGGHRKWNLGEEKSPEEDDSDY